VITPPVIDLIYSDRVLVDDLEFVSIPVSDPKHVAIKQLHIKE
jgi:hypothetical protein